MSVRACMNLHSLLIVKEILGRVMVQYCKALTRLLFLIRFERGVSCLIESTSPKVIGITHGFELAIWVLVNK